MLELRSRDILTELFGTEYPDTLTSMDNPPRLCMFSGFSLLSEDILLYMGAETITMFSRYSTCVQCSELPTVSCRCGQTDMAKSVSTIAALTMVYLPTSNSDQKLVNIYLQYSPRERSHPLILQLKGRFSTTNILSIYMFCRILL